MFGPELSLWHLCQKNLTVTCSRSFSFLPGAASIMLQSAGILLSERRDVDLRRGPGRGGNATERTKGGPPRRALLTCRARAAHRSAAMRTRDFTSGLAAGLAGFIFLGSLASPLLARPLVPAERRYFPFTGMLPACSDPKVLERVSSQFAGVEDEYWKSDLKILSYDLIREIGYRSDGLDLIPRRYCQARGNLQRRARPVQSRTISPTNSVSRATGSASNSVSSDSIARNAYAPACKMARP